MMNFYKKSFVVNYFADYLDFVLAVAQNESDFVWLFVVDFQYL
jgi:hypothetical protein